MIQEPEQDKKKPRRSLIYYYVVTLLILMLLNALLFPSLLPIRISISATTSSSTWSETAR